MSARIAAVDGGTYYHDDTLRAPRYREIFDRTIYIRDLPEADLSEIDIFIASCSADSTSLRRAQPMLDGFLERGGTVVVMGANSPNDWIGHLVTWQDVPSNWWWWLDPKASSGLTVGDGSHGLYKRMTLRDATWHYHGQLVTPPGAVSLVNCEYGGSILYDDRASTAGRIIATTLDPFYHHGSRFMPAATRFLDAFLPWLKDGAP